MIVKKIVSSILIVIIFGQIFAPFSFNIWEKNISTTQTAEAASDCEIVDVVIPTIPTKHNSYDKEDKRPKSITFTVKTANCLNKPNVTLSLNIQEKDFARNDKLLEGHQKGPFANDDLKFMYIPGEMGCEDGSCEIYYSIRLVEDGKEIDNYTNNDTGFYCTSKDKDGKDFCANGEVDDGNGNKPTINWEWSEESASPTAEFWFFKVKYSDGTGFMYSPYNTEALCNEKRELINKAAGEGTEVGPCEFKKNEQIISSIVYYYEILNKNVVTGQSETFGTIDECNSNRKAFEDGQSDENITTSECKQKEEKQVVGGIDHGGEETSGLPACSILPMRLGGCIAQGIYYLFFKTSSYLFAQIGIILDFSIMYSIDDDSYKSSFVVEGWGIVRDFCNMFFIFILLYIAFGTILGLHSVKTKETIINVILIGLLINFSLFATQVIIDASNILTRVFYNENTISTGTKEGGVVKSKLGIFGEIQLSSAIVNKVDPQKLILEATTVNDIQIRGASSGEDQESVQTSKGEITVGTFILVTLLATAINVVGIVVFLSSALIFITRVLGLWLAMILAPLAFFSYIVPSMKSFKMIGWSHWWPETLKLAFLAPVFMFFIYLIIKFLDKGLGLVDAATRSGAAKSGMGLVVSIVVPFIFIMVLLMKAKDIAKDMSGEMGQKITGAVAAVGGMALGGAALGTAVLGRNLIGKTINSATKSDSAIHYGNQKVEYNKKLEEWKQKGKVGAKPKWDDHLNSSLVDIGGKKYFENSKGETVEYKKSMFNALGGSINAKQKHIGEVDHARHTIDEAKDKAGFKDIDYDRLSGTQRERVRNEFIKSNKSKWSQEEEEKFRKIKGYDSKQALSPAEVQQLNDNIKKRAASEFDKELHHATEQVSGFARTISKINTGSMDIRKLSDMKSDKRESFLTKIPVGLISGIATGVRGGLKSSGLSNGSIKVEGSFIKDLTNTISDSLKSINVKVDLSHVGEHKSSADSHGGGDHH